MWQERPFWIIWVALIWSRELFKQRGRWSQRDVTKEKGEIQGPKGPTLALLALKMKGAHKPRTGRALLSWEPASSGSWQRNGSTVLEQGTKFHQQSEWGRKNPPPSPQKGTQPYRPVDFGGVRLGAETQLSPLELWPKGTVKIVSLPEPVWLSE